MLAYHNDQTIKEKYLARVKGHRLYDEMIKDTNWEAGKEFIIGSPIHISDYENYEKKLGIPEWLARLEDTIFMGLPDKIEKLWSYQFLDTITPGQDLDKIKAPFFIFILESVLDKFDHNKFPDVKKCVDTVIELYRSGETDIEKFITAERAARKADEARWADENTAGTCAAMLAAREAVWSAWAAARAPRPVWVAEQTETWQWVAWVEEARAPRVAWAVWSAAREADGRQAKYEKFADKILELIKEFK